MPRYEWTGGPNILGALDLGVQVSRGSNYTPTEGGRGDRESGERKRERVLNFYTSCVFIYREAQRVSTYMFQYVYRFNYNILV